MTNYTSSKDSLAICAEHCHSLAMSEEIYWNTRSSVYPNGTRYERGFLAVARLQTSQIFSTSPWR